jgi:hypothetical protein
MSWHCIEVLGEESPRKNQYLTLVNRKPYQTHAQMPQMVCKTERWLGLLFHDYLTFVIKLVLVPKSTVAQVQLACGGTDGKIRHLSLVVGSSFVPSSSGNLSFRMCHDSLGYFKTFLISVMRQLICY